MMAVKSIPWGCQTLDSLKTKLMHSSYSPGDATSHLAQKKCVWQCKPVPPVSLSSFHCSAVQQFRAIRKLCSGSKGLPAAEFQSVSRDVWEKLSDLRVRRLLQKNVHKRCYSKTH